MGDTVTEDFRFAMELLRRRYKTFQSATRVSIRSPNTLADFVRQRARWANALRDAARYRNAPYIGLIAAGFALWTAVPLTLLYGPGIPLLISAVYAAVYLYGSLKAKRYVLDVWLASLLELVGLAAGIIKKGKTFYVLDKT
jgi:cellulose synthase/poly-beta-1,6-N-acetylglucosamine synthase-like glycosyltransferase